MYTREKNINILLKEFIKTEIIESRDHYLDRLKIDIEFLEERIETNEKWIAYFSVILFFLFVLNIILLLSKI
jgi:hypothetical protein